MNAKQEFLKHIEGNELVCAKIGTVENMFVLKDNYTKEEFDEFCQKLDFEYDSGFGNQELFGIILFKDSYSDRYEYDGSECWDYHKKPTVAEVLTRKYIHV